MCGFEGMYTLNRYLTIVEYSGIIFSMSENSIFVNAEVAELADAQASGACGR